MINNGSFNRHSFLGIIVSIMAVTILIFGCGDGGGGSGGGSGDTTATMVITPSLGLILDYTLEMSLVDGSPISITTEVKTDGSVEVTYPASVTGPVYVEILGNDTATYFDEASGMFQPFTNAQSFRTYMTSTGCRCLGFDRSCSGTTRQYFDNHHGTHHSSQ